MESSRQLAYFSCHVIHKCTGFWVRGNDVGKIAITLHYVFVILHVNIDTFNSYATFKDAYIHFVPHFNLTLDILLNIWLSYSSLLQWHISFLLLFSHRAEGFE